MSPTWQWHEPGLSLMFYATSVHDVGTGLSPREAVIERRLHQADVFSPPLLRRLVSNGRLQRGQEWLEQADVPLLLAVRLVPVISFNLVNFVLGCTTIRWRRFTWTTALGIVPVTLVSISVGAHWRDWRVVLAFCVAAGSVAIAGYAVMRSRMQHRGR